MQQKDKATVTTSADPAMTALGALLAELLSTILEARRRKMRLDCSRRRKAEVLKDIGLDRADFY